jgi:nucleoside-triphosphatase THEP1
LNNAAVETGDPCFAWGRELAAIQERLARREPALVGLLGKSGIGKTTLLRKLASAATASGWLVLGDSDAGLAVVEATTPQAFHASITDELQQKLPASRFEALDAGLDAVDLAALLRHAGQVLITIDGFDPTEEFARWFFEAFVIETLHASTPIFILCADANLPESRVEAVGGSVYRLSALEPDRVRHILATCLGPMVPAMEGAELESYIEQLSEHPELLYSVLQILRLAEPAESDRGD